MHSQLQYNHTHQYNTLTAVVVDDAKRIRMQMPKELAPYDLRILAHEHQIAQVVLIRVGGVAVWQIAGVPFVRSGRNVPDDVDLKKTEELGLCGYSEGDRSVSNTLQTIGYYIQYIAKWHWTGLCTTHTNIPVIIRAEPPPAYLIFIKIRFDHRKQNMLTAELPQDRYSHRYSPHIHRRPSSIRIRAQASHTNRHIYNIHITDTRTQQ